MDLALELGFPTVEAMRCQMSEHELGRWYAYARKRMLPGRRRELQLANIARLTAGSDAIAPFIFDPSLRTLLEPLPVPATAEDTAGLINAMIGGPGVYKLGERKIKDILDGR